MTERGRKVRRGETAHSFAPPLGKVQPRAVQRRALLHANPSCVAPCIAVAGLLHRRLVQTLLQWGSVMSSKAVKSAIALVRPSATEPDWSRERCEAFWEPS